MKLTVLLTIFFFAVITSVHAQGNQLLANPDFDEGTNGWWHLGATVTSNNGEVYFDIATPGTYPWDVQFGQGNITLRKGYKYTLHWRAKRESGIMEFRVAMGSEPYTSYIYSKGEGFDSNWQESSAEYIHTEDDMSDIGVTLQMGGNDANATIDYIYLTEEPVTTEKIKVTFQVDMQHETVSENGVFINGSFDNWETPIKMQSNGTIYSVKLQLDKGSTVEYKYVNGDIYETISGDCTTGDNNNRSLTVPESDHVFDAICFNSCFSCTDPSILSTNPGVGPVSYYGKMQVSGNRIIGERTHMPMQVKGISFFWSIWGGEKLWTPGAVNALVDDWKAELIRTPMSVENDDEWGTSKGYLNPVGTQPQIENVERLVDAAIARDIYVIIDFHSHEAHLHTEQAKEFFGYMANKYGNYDNVIFEIYNEPIDPDWPTIKAYAEAVIDTIREHSENLVLAGTEFYSQRVDNASLSPINDHNTAYVFHFYASHQEELREIVRTALNNNVALFASEWGNIYVHGENEGLTTEDGFENSDSWHELMDEHSISSANWCVYVDNFKNASGLFYDENGMNGDVSLTGKNWEDASIISPSGMYVYNMLKQHASTGAWRKAEHTSTVQVTFRVDMRDENISSEGVFLEGSFKNWESAIEMTSNNTVYSVTIELPIDDYVEYRFRNGDSLEEGENGDCFGWDKNRLLIVPEADVSIDPVCFNTCGECIVIETFLVDAVSSPANGGEISGTGTYEEGADITLTATPHEGYEFINWTKDGIEISGDSMFTVNVSENLDLVANFRLITGIEDFSFISIHIFPNPTKSIITIEGLPVNENLSLNIYSIEGKLILESTSKYVSVAQMDLESLKTGFYFLVVKGNNIKKTLKVSKM